MGADEHLRDAASLVEGLAVYGLVALYDGGKVNQLVYRGEREGERG